MYIYAYIHRQNILSYVSEYIHNDMDHYATHTELTMNIYIYVCLYAYIHRHDITIF